MKRFLLQILFGASLITILLIGVVVWRLYAVEQMAKERFSVDGACPILVLGDSHADSSFCEGREFGIWVAGHHSTPLNFSLMRLKEIERRGGLRGVKICIVNFCYTTTGAKTRENQLLSAWYFFPYCLKYREWIPVSNWELACYLVGHAKLFQCDIMMHNRAEEIK